MTRDRSDAPDRGSHISARSNEVEYACKVSPEISKLDQRRGAASAWSLNVDETRHNVVELFGCKSSARGLLPGVMDNSNIVLQVSAGKRCQ